MAVAAIALAVSIAAPAEARKRCRPSAQDTPAACRATADEPVALRLRARPTGESRRGEGLLILRMAAPGTSWADGSRTSVVVDVTLDEDPARTQTIVLFTGGEPHTYRGFTGPIRRGRHRVSVAVNRELSETGDASPKAEVLGAELALVTRDDPDHAALAHAPVLYGRNVSARSDTPLLTYAQTSDRRRTIAYTTIFSNEDSGSGVVPAYLWGTYGRMTDIEASATVKLNKRRRFQSATYQSCEGCPDPYPQDVTGVEHTESEFDGERFFGHPILRVSTGNNVFEDSGTTAFRFHQALVAPPPPGELREAVMDRHPWTYEIMDHEVQRERADRSTNPRDFLAGRTHQYAVVELDVQAAGTRSIAVEVQLEGDPTWYSNDYRQTNGVIGSSFAFYNGGMGRTVIKLPEDWHGRQITRVRLRLNHSVDQQPVLEKVRELRVLEVTRGFEVRQRDLPRRDPPVFQPTVVDGGVLP